MAAKRLAKPDSVYNFDYIGAYAERETITDALTEGCTYFAYDKNESFRYLNGNWIPASLNGCWGKATSGSLTSLTDTSKTFDENGLIGHTAKIIKDGVTYLKQITANTANSITYTALRSAVAAVAHILLAETYDITVTAATAGAAGNAYTIKIVAAEGADDNMSAAFADGVITVTLGKTAGELDDTKNTAVLIAAAIDAITEVTAVFAGTDGVVAATTADITFSGGLDSISAAAGDYYEIVGATNNVFNTSIIGSNNAVTFANNAAVNTQVTVNIARPLNVKDVYKFTVYNPSTVTDLTVKVFNVEPSLGSAERLEYLGSVTVPKSQSITGTTINTYPAMFEGCFIGTSVRLIVSNNTALGAADAFSAYIRVREVD